MSKEHTQLPWEPHGRFEITCGDIPIASTTPHTSGAFNRTESPAETNRDFILLAVNHHEELVGMIRELLSSEGHQSVLTRIKAAKLLAKLEVKP